MNTIREVQKINERELELGIAGTSASWHAQYSKSAWIYVGNVDVALSERHAAIRRPRHRLEELEGLAGSGEDPGLVFGLFPLVPFVLVPAL